MKYIVGRYYRSKRAEYQAGQLIEIDDPEQAAWLKRDMGGYLEPYVEGRAVEAPPQDRMVKKASKRAAANTGGMIDRSVFKATRNKGD